MNQETNQVINHEGKNKGNFGYLSYQKKYQVIKTCLFFLVPLALFFAGMYMTHSKMNLLTVVAVLGMLPASKSAVLMFMFLKSHPTQKEIFDQVTKEVNTPFLSFDNVFTTYEETFEVPVLFVKNNQVVFYHELKNSQAETLEKHMESYIKKEGIAADAKGMTQLNGFIQRFHQLSEDEEQKREAEIMQIIHDISL